MFNVAIIGGEGYENYPKFQEKCIKILKNKSKSGEGITILSTGDEIVAKFAEKFRITLRPFYCDWKSHGKNALKVRNERLLENCDAIILFDDGIKDNQIILNMAKEKKIPNRKII